MGWGSVAASPCDARPPPSQCSADRPRLCKGRYRTEFAEFSCTHRSRRSKTDVVDRLPFDSRPQQRATAVAEILSPPQDSASLVALLIAAGGYYGYRKAEVLAADPQGEKDCLPAPQGVDNTLPDITRVRAIKPLDGVTWSQLGGTINDASCLNRIDVYGIVEVRTVDDIAKRARLCARQQAHGLGRRRPALDGRARLPQGRRRARHDEVQPHRAQRRRCPASRCSRARPGTTSRISCIRASRCRPCSRPTSSPSAARSRSTPTAWTIRPAPWRARSARCA